MAKAKSKSDPVAKVVKDAPELGSTPPDQPNPEAMLQHPSLGDDAHNLEADSGVEIAERSQDVPEPTAEAHRKDFVVLKREWGEAEPVDVEKKHVDNIEATRQYLMHQGLRPTGDGSFVGEEDHPDGVSLILHYEVPVEPSVVAEDREVQHAHVTLDDQRDYEKRLKDNEPGT